MKSWVEEWTGAGILGVFSHFCAHQFGSQFSSESGQHSKRKEVAAAAAALAPAAAASLAKIPGRLGRDSDFKVIAM